MELVETVANEPQRRAITIVDKNDVYYSVETFEDGQWKTIWEERVKFGRDKTHRVGGYAFKRAVFKQEHCLSTGTV